MAQENYIELKGRKFYLSSLTPAQYVELNKRLGINLTNLSEKLKEVSGDVGQMIIFLGVVMNEEGVSHKDKNIDALIDLLMYDISIDDLTEALNFFTKYGSVISKGSSNTPEEKTAMIHTLDTKEKKPKK